MESSSGLSKAQLALVVGLSLVVLLAVAFGILRSYPTGSARGSIRSAGLPHGDVLVEPVACFNGGHWDFDGVWVTTAILTEDDHSGFRGGAKLVKTASGQWQVWVENPNACKRFKCEQWVVDPNRCSRFDVSVGNSHLGMRRHGHARLECTYPEGGTLQIDLDFSGCAEVG